MSDNYRPWLFDASITDPDGIEVHIHVRVPAGALWGAQGDSETAISEAAEITQVSAVQAINRIASYKGRPPF